MAEPIPDFTDAERGAANPALPERRIHVHSARQGATQPLPDGLSVLNAGSDKRVSA